MCFAFLVYGFLNYGRMTVGMYYFTYVWGDVSLFTLYATVNGLICAVAAFFSAALVKLCRGKRGALLLSYGLSFILNIILFFLSPENASSTLVLVLLFGTGIFNGFCTALLYGMIGDTVEYGPVEDRRPRGRPVLLRYELHAEARRRHRPDDAGSPCSRQRLCGRRCHADRGRPVHHERRHESGSRHSRGH